MSQTKRRQRTERNRQAPGSQPLPGFWRECGQVLGLYALTLLLFSWIFPPGGLWPLAFVCLVPWAVATCRTRRA